MPDMLFHMSFALLLGVILKIKNWKLLITGALLPDFSRILLIILTFLGFDEVKTYLILEPWHTPFICLLLSLSIALLFKEAWKNFCIIFLGVITHFILDSLQFSNNFGQILFYPIYFKQYSLNLFYAGKIIFPLIGVFMLIISLYYLKQKNELVFSKKYFYLSFIPLIITLFFLFSTPVILLNNNIYGINFLAHPEKYINKEVGLYNSKIVSVNPLTLNEMGKKVLIETDKKLELNSKISVKGIYKNNRIYVNEIFFHNFNKEIFSIMGLLVYFILLLKNTFILSAFENSF